MAAGVPLMKGVFSRQGRLQWREVSDDLQQRLVRRSKPLCLEPEQYFNCLIRKRVYVRDVPSTDGYIPLNEWLLVRFHPVVIRSCAISDCDDGKAPLMDMPVVRPERYFPYWLRLDYWHGESQAVFGYASLSSG
jgi:hypothetical protein